jgi:hypothetical protein
MRALNLARTGAENQPIQVVGGATMLRNGKPGWITIFVFGLFQLVLAIGCGGSGGGGGIDYEGNREAAVVTGDNAQTLAAAAYDSATLEGPFASFASLSGEAPVVIAIPGGRPTVLAVADVLTAALDEAKAVPALPQEAPTASMRALDAGSYTINGSCGGTAGVQIEIEQGSGVFAGQFDFNDYCDDGTALTGSASFQGQVDPDTDQLDYFTFRFSSLLGTAKGAAFRLDGGLTLRVNETRDETSLTMDLLFEDMASGESLWLNDFTLTVTDGVDNGQAYETIAFSGRLYHSVHGYVDTRTDVAFRLDDGDDYPSEGILVLTGADDATVVMTVISNTQYQVEADLDGDEAYDWGPETYDWEDT